MTNDAIKTAAINAYIAYCNATDPTNYSLDEFLQYNAYNSLDDLDISEFAPHAFRLDFYDECAISILALEFECDPISDDTELRFMISTDEMPFQNLPA